MANENRLFSGSSAFTTIDLDNGLLADGERLEKMGPLGKTINKHRRATLIVAGVLIAVGGATLLFVASTFLLGSLRMVAAGFSYKFGESELPVDSVRLASGLVVERVLEPQAAMTELRHAMLLVDSLLENRARPPLTRDDFARGYLQWRASEFEPEHNFTLAAARKLARSLVDEPVCVCYATLGIPHNIVYLRDSDEVLFAPRVEAFSARAELVHVMHNAQLFGLLNGVQKYREGLARGSARTLDESAPLAQPAVGAKAFVTPDAGTIEHVSESGYLRRRVFAESQFPCINQCISIFVDYDEHAERERLNAQT